MYGEVVRIGHDHESFIRGCREALDEGATSVHTRDGNACHRRALFVGRHGAEHHEAIENVLATSVTTRPPVKDAEGVAFGDASVRVKTVGNLALAVPAASA
jgi:hypothetical protein